MRVLSIILALMVAVNAYATSGFVARYAVPYRDGVERCVADIYCPEDNSRSLPVVVWFHGGGLTGGERAVPEELKNGRYVVVAPSYRLMPDATVNDCIDDAAAAVAWVFNNISNYGGDPGNVIVSGHSAGGYLTSMIGLDKKWLARYGVDSDSIKALVPFSGQVITHFAVRDKQGINALTPTVDEYSPLFYARKLAAPYIIICGDREMEIFGRYEENAYMWRIMKLWGNEDVFIYEMDGHDHGAMCHPAFHIMKNHIDSLIKKQ